ncbi:MAG TPA: hypothetical protein VKP88_04760, partial [Candidatus Paceibacterota bacterium]|nr:hypothetical protein [Candidatus Paceibacterota bacterium]
FWFHLFCGIVRRVHPEVPMDTFNQPETDPLYSLWWWERWWQYCYYTILCDLPVNVAFYNLLDEETD